MPEVKVQTTVKFDSWVIPNFVHRQDRDSTVSVHVKDVGQEVIDALVQDWLARLYTTAGKTNPFKRTAYR